MRERRKGIRLISTPVKTHKLRKTGSRKRAKQKVRKVGVPREQSTFPHLLSSKSKRD